MSKILDMLMSNYTTIRITKKLKRDLDKLKVSKRDTYNQVIENLVEDTYELSDQAKKDLAEALDDIKNGRIVSHEQVKKELGL